MRPYVTQGLKSKLSVGMGFCIEDEEWPYAKNTQKTPGRRCQLQAAIDIISAAAVCYAYWRTLPAFHSL